MGANVEIKARARAPERMRSLAEELSGGPPRRLEQEDTFFHTEAGRLKLRVFPPRPGQDRAHGELIAYRRVDAEGPTRSEYRIHPTDDPAGLNETLAAALGVRGVVRKTRLLHLVDQTRIHLDTVEGLGDFVELEVVLRPDQTTAEGTAIAHALMEKLEILPEDLIDVAYIDMLDAPVEAKAEPAVDSR